MRTIYISNPPGSTPKTESNLEELALKNDSNKCAKNGSSYAYFYSDLFSEKKNTINKILEIGKGEKLYNNLNMWQDFLPNAKIYGSANGKIQIPKKGRIRIFQRDAEKQESLHKLINKIGDNLNVVIDEGGRDLTNLISTCQTILPLLRKEVTYVIENTNQQEAASIINNLKNYNCKVLRRSRMLNRYDRLIVVTNITENSKRLGSAKVSIIVPSCNEIHEVTPGVTVLQRTVRDIYENATGNFEVIVGFNGPTYQDFPNYPNFRTVKLPENIGIKALINMLCVMAAGKYIYKTDAHCKFGKGFDEILLANMQDNWLVTPRFYVLNPDTWEWQDERHYDYFYLCCPFTDPRGFRFKAGGHWPERTVERENDHKYDIDETPQFHGSGWFVEKDFFLNKIGGFPNNDPQGHAQEPPNIGLKYWLGSWDGKVMVNKKTWYAHMHQANQVKGYHYTRQEERTSYDIWARYWMADKWGERVHNIDWFIEKFMPMPTWPENWRVLLENWRKSQRHSY